MLNFKRLVSTLLLAVTFVWSPKAYRIFEDEVIWQQGMPIEQAISHLEQLAVEALHRDNAVAETLPADVPARFFQDMHLVGRFSGRRAQTPLTGLEWNNWYPWQLERLRADREAYFRSVRETRAEASRFERDRRH